eukprot:scaffold258968_cov43-Attheya_sp.AAC.1
MFVFFKAWWWLSGFAPFGIGHFLAFHVQAHKSEIFFQGSFRAHGILFHGGQKALGQNHILGRFWIPQLVFDAIQNQHLQWVVHSMRKHTMHRLPKFWLVPSHIHVPYHAPCRRKYIVSRCPQPSRHDYFLPHENPRQEWIKRYLPKKI